MSGKLLGLWRKWRNRSGGDMDIEGQIQELLGQMDEIVHSKLPAAISSFVSEWWTCEGESLLKLQEVNFQDERIKTRISEFWKKIGEERSSLEERAKRVISGLVWPHSKELNVQNPLDLNPLSCKETREVFRQVAGPLEGHLVSAGFILPNLKRRNDEMVWMADYPQVRSVIEEYRALATKLQQLLVQRQIVEMQERDAVIREPQNS